MTNPFDVIKTRRQAAADAGAITKAASASSNRTFTLLRTIGKQEGYAGLFSGLTPRLAKVGTRSRIRLFLLEKAKSLTRRDNCWFHPSGPIGWTCMRFDDRLLRSHLVHFGRLEGQHRQRRGRFVVLASQIGRVDASSFLLTSFISSSLQSHKSL